MDGGIEHELVFKFKYTLEASIRIFCSDHGDDHL